MLIYALIIGAVVLLYTRLPSSFLPNEDQGYLLVNVQGPPGATDARTRQTLAQVELLPQQAARVEKIVTVAGFSFAGLARTRAWASSR